MNASTITLNGETLAMTGGRYVGAGDRAVAESLLGGPVSYVGESLTQGGMQNGHLWRRKQQD